MSTVSGLMWVEKYRPKRLEDMVDQREVVESLTHLLSRPAEMPHLLFSGPPGNGKTTAALCIARQIFGEEWREFTLELNASDERGINIVRSKVKTFSRFRGMSTELPFRLIILDEADMMTSEAQTALRRIMEQSAERTRFCLICNYSSRIISPIQSRCAVFKFRPLAREDFESYLSRICEKEEVAFDEDALEEIYGISGGDLRKGLNILQSSASVRGSVTAEAVRDLAGVGLVAGVREVLESAVSGNYIEARRRLFEYMGTLGLSGTDVIRFMMTALEEMGRLDSSIVDVLAEYDFRLLEGANEDIQLSALLAKLTAAFQGS